MRPNHLHNYNDAFSDFMTSCQTHGWTRDDTSAVSPSGWIKVQLNCKVVDATEDPIAAQTSVTFSPVDDWRSGRNPFTSLASYAADVATAAEIQWLMEEWQDLYVAWPSKLSAAQKRIVNLLRDGHKIAVDTHWLSKRRYYCNGVKPSDVALDKLREFGIVNQCQLVRLPDPDPVQ